MFLNYCFSSLLLNFLCPVPVSSCLFAQECSLSVSDNFLLKQSCSKLSFSDWSSAVCVGRNHVPLFEAADRIVATELLGWQPGHRWWSRILFLKLQCGQQPDSPGHAGFMRNTPCGHQLCWFVKWVCHVFVSFGWTGGFQAAVFCSSLWSKCPFRLALGRWSA